MKFFAVLLLLCSVAKANYNSIIIGDQAAGMGGAYVAMPEDASAHGWYNPANLARLTGKSFSASVGVYKKFDTRFGDVEDITKATLRANQGFFQPLPSSLGSVVRFKEQLPDWTMAMSILTPHYDSFSGYVSNTETNTSRLSQIDQTLWVGGVIAKPVSASESIGISLYYLAHNYARNVSVTTALGGNQVRTYLEEKTFYQNSIVQF
jgi:long-chain fatty acid transport protein